jgi:hypothetical protein
MEVLVAVSVLSLLGLMAWRGMDAMIRGKEVIDQRSESDSKFLYLAKQFDKDCSEIPNASQIGFSPIEIRGGELWLLRRMTINGQLNWILLVYKADGAGLKRQTILNTLNLLEVKAYLTSPSINQNSSQANMGEIYQINEISHQALELIPQSNEAATYLSRGIKVQWHAKNFQNPMTRSCLFGQGL